MFFKNHDELLGKHAILSPSQYHWLNYDAEKMKKVYLNNKRKEEGTFKHDLASRLIMTRTYVERNIPSAFHMFVNDSIDDNMFSEVPLKYSDNAFGTADAIRYNDKTGELRIYDLKTGMSKPSFKQLLIYCAYFCLEYGKEPTQLRYVLRLYQNDGFEEYNPDGHEILDVMTKVIELDGAIESVKYTNYFGRLGG